MSRAVDEGWRHLFGPDPVVLDGGLSTQLTRLGEDINGSLWTGRVLLANPSAVTRAQADFVRAGADVVITASYQVSRRGFEEAGLTSGQADAALMAATSAARAAVDAVPGSSARVAASVGPYGAILHDGSEYRGRYGLTRQQLVDFHRERLDVLVSSRPDLLAVETIPDVAEAEALVDVLADHPDMPAWLTFSAMDDAHVCAGQSIEEAVTVAASAPSVVAVGINCTDPRYVTGLVRRMRSVSDLPIVVYPNAGGEWDASDGEWHGVVTEGPAGAFPDRMVREWLDSGAAAVGGCCGTDAGAISRIAQLMAQSAG
jgi:homocysteine S-methyltransferase